MERRVEIMKRVLLISCLGILMTGQVITVKASENVPADLATQILEGEFSDESKESVYKKVKELLDLTKVAVQSNINIDGIFGVDELIDRFGDDYTYTDDMISYDMWVVVNTFKLTAAINEDNKVEYFYGYFYPTFETIEPSDSEEDLELVKDTLANLTSLPSFEALDAAYEDYDFSFIQDEMTYISGSQSYTYAWDSKELLKYEVGQANYGRANLTITQADIDTLNEIEDLGIQRVIETVGENWTYVYNIQEDSQQFIWKDPLGKTISVDVTDELMVNKIEAKGLNE